MSKISRNLTLIPFRKIEKILILRNRMYEIKGKFPLFCVNFTFVHKKLKILCMS